MGLVIIELLRTAPFLKDAKVVIGADMDETNVNPNSLKTEGFSGRSTGTARIAINYSLDHGRYAWDEKYLPVDELKKLVPKCAIMNDTTKQMIKSYEEINFWDKNDPFFCNDDMTVLMSKGRAVLDDNPETNPRNKVMAAFFFADQERFMKVEIDEEPSFSDEIYSIGMVEHVEKARQTAAMSEINIASRLSDMGRPQLRVLAKVWDINMTDNTSDDMMKARIFDLIKASPVTLGAKSRANWFGKYVNFPKETMMMYDLFMDGRRTRLIDTTDENHFRFNGTVMGRNEDESVEFLLQAMNENITKTLKEGVKFRKKQGAGSQDLGLYEETLAAGKTLKDGQQPSDPQ